MSLALRDAQGGWAHSGFVGACSACWPLVGIIPVCSLPCWGGADRNKILEQSGRNTPVIGFTVCYDAANVLLAEGHCSLR